MHEISFEFFPPKTEQGLKKLNYVTEQLATFNPHFFSVTFGAGGTSYQSNLTAVNAIKNNTPINTAPHLSCINMTKTYIKHLLEQYQAYKINTLICLRGDMPNNKHHQGDFQYASELISFIRQQTQDYFRLFVAAYPESHPESGNAEKDFYYFKKKIDAGANAAITQYFYNIDAYCYFRDYAIKEGITIPIIPGIMPIVNYEKLQQFSKNCGAEIPRWLCKKLDVYQNDMTSLKSFANDFVLTLCDRLLQHGAPGLHFYTLNQLEPCLYILKNLNIVACNKDVTEAIV